MVLYKKKETVTAELIIEERHTESVDEADEDDEFGVEIDDVGDKFEKDDEKEIVDDFKPIIDKVRKTDFKREYELIHDTETRWNSLDNMLERFYKLRNCVGKALVDLDPDLKLEQREIKINADVVDTLKAVQLAVEALCRRDANLITADAILLFAFEQLHKQKNELLSKLFNALKSRISARRTELSSVLQYLHSGDQETTTINELRPIFDSPSKRKVETVILKLIKRCHSESTLKVSCI